VKEGDYLQFIRWQKFWGRRVYGGDSNKRGSFLLYTNAIDKFLNSNAFYTHSAHIGSGWLPLGPYGDSLSQHLGLVSAIYIDTLLDPSMNTIFLGTNRSGIWKTTDGGATWGNVTDEIGFPLLGITDIKGDPTDGNALYASTGSGSRNQQLYHGSTGFGFGILKSTNAGRSWSYALHFIPQQLWNSQTQKSYDFMPQVYKLLIDPFNSGWIYALIDSCVIRSKNYGISWDTIFNQLHANGRRANSTIYLRDLALKPNNSHFMYIVTDDWHGTRAEVWGTDSLQLDHPHWTCLVSNLAQINTDSVRTQRFKLAVSSADPNAIYLACQDTNHARIKVWRSTGFSNWNLKISIPDNLYGIDYNRIELLVSPTDTSVIYLAGYDISKFIHGQLSFEYQNNDINYHVDTRCSEIIKGSDTANGSYDIIFVGNDGGISKTTDGIHHFSNLNGDGLAITDFWGIGSSKSTPRLIAGGTQDNSIYIYDNGNWTHSQGDNSDGCDAGNFLVDKNNNNTYLYGPRWNLTGGNINILKSSNKGTSWDVKDIPSCFDNYVTNPPIVKNPLNPKSFYLGGHSIVNFLDRANSSKCIDVPGYINSGEGISAIGISPHDTNIIYISYENPTWYPDTVKFLKLNRNTNTWDNLTNKVSIQRGNNINNMLGVYGITDIALSPTSTDSIWISFGGFNNLWWPSRVLFSSNGGNSWIDISDSLPDFPINRIKYWNGKLFIANDVGVYYRDKFDSFWKPFNNNLPFTTVMDLEINDSTKMMYAGTYGRGLFMTDISCEYETEPLVIHHDTTWSLPVILNQGVIIDSLTTLTITDTVFMPNPAKICVQPHAKLVIDGGVITSKCSDMWDGIEVWGNANRPSSEVYQGYIILKNGAIIENSRIAIRTCKRDQYGEILFQTAGGMIYAENSFLKNNYKAVEFIGTRYPQVSSFYNVTFETTQMPLVDGLSYPKEFVSMDSVNGVVFRGCKFLNIGNKSGKPTKQSGSGIYSINSSYSVVPWGYCTQPIKPCPPQDLAIIPSRFSGLNYGIKALNVSPITGNSIYNTQFDHNLRSIYLSGVWFAEITQNSFYFPSGGTGFDTNKDTIYGIYLDHCLNYHIEADTCKSNYTLSPPDIKSIGMIIHQSGDQPNLIYNNVFDSLKIAVLAEDQNRTKSSSGEGLVLKCNDYSHTRYDEAITVSEQQQSWGIALNQGDSLTDQGPAGNTFSLNHNSSLSLSDISNDGMFFNYFCQRQVSPSSRLKPIYRSFQQDSIFEITKFHYNKRESCPSTINNGNPSPDNLKEQLSQQQYSIDSIASILNSFVDGGNTSALNSNVLFSVSPEAFELHQDLLNKSPYLSDTVMKSAIQKENVLPNEMVRDVLVANPQSGKSEEIINQLNQRTISMPDSMMAEILDGRLQTSSKDNLESHRIIHTLTKSQIFSNLVRFYQTDTINPVASRDSLISLFQNDNSITSKYLVAFKYLEINDTLHLNLTLTSIPLSFLLDNSQLQLHQDYLSYFQILKSLKSKHQNWHQLPQNIVYQLQTLAGNSKEPVRTFARNILIMNNFMDYSEPITLPNENTKSAPDKGFIKTSKISSQTYMKLYPNPSNQYIIIEFNLKEKYNSGRTVQFLVSNITGSQLCKFYSGKSQDQMLFNTSLYPSGQYICTLIIDGKLIESQKFTISHN